MCTDTVPTPSLHEDLRKVVMEKACKSILGLPLPCHAQTGSNAWPDVFKGFLSETHNFC